MGNAEISFSNSGLARAKLNSAVPGGALQVPRSRWPRWFRCSHVSLCCSSLLSRCSYHFFTWAPFHSGHGWTPDSALLPRRFLYVVLACGRVRMIQRSCRFGRQGRLPALNSYHPCTPDVCMRRLYNPSHRLLVIRRAVSNPNVDLWPSAPNAQLLLNLTSAHRGPPVQIPNDPRGS